jgi:hypothetical protein
MDMLSSNGGLVVRSTVAPVLVALALGCDSAVHPSAPEQPVQKQPTPTDSATAGLHIKLTGDTSWAYVDREFSLAVKATDEHGNLVDADLAQISTSDPSVARLDQSFPWSEIPYPGGPTIKMVMAQFDLAAVGTTVFRARLGDLTDSITVMVHPLPPPTQALVVDSFYVVESHDCPSGCSSVSYWPVMRLHEPTGTSHAAVVAVYFSVPTVNTRLCTGSLLFEPGSFQYVDTKRENYYASDLEMAPLNGQPVPDGPATARVIVSDSQGHLGSIEMTGPILRGPNAPIVPTSQSDALNWLCWGGV